MKTLIIVRHAKSSWANIGQADFDRDLNERGKKDGPEMAKRLVGKKIDIDQFISSPARRAKKTCEAFCKAFNVNDNKIIFIEKLYHAASDAFYQVIETLDQEWKTVTIFSHNPGITEFVNTLCKEVNIDNMPTCAVFGVSSDIKNWKEFEKAEKEFLFFDYPKSGN
ncbi:MAG: histidine phosphatase family protein [Ferruginibacter sp.]